MRNWTLWIKNSIQNKIVIPYFLLIIILVAITSSTLYMVSENTVEEQVSTSRVDVLNQVARNIDIVINQVTSVMNLYYYDQELLKLISVSSSHENVDEKSIVNIFNKYSISFISLNIKHYSMIHLFGREGYSYWVNDYYDFDNIEQRQWYQDIVKADGEIAWINTFNDKKGFNEDKYVFTAGRLLKNIYTMDPIGVLLLHLEEADLYNIYKDAMDGNKEIYIINKDGVIISSANKKDIGTSLLDKSYIQKILEQKEANNIVANIGQKKLLSYSPIYSVDWMIVEEIDYNKVLDPMRNLKYVTQWMIILFALGGFILSYYIGKRVTYPIQSLHKVIQEVEEGNLDVEAEILSEDEIGDLGLGFNKMIVKINELVEGVKEEGSKKRKMELDFLQAQIRPHFLSNTLTTVRATMAMGNIKEADKMIVSLNKLIRKTFTDRNELITLGEEIDFLKEYITLQQTRYNNKLDVVIDIAESIKPYKILKMTLQPLIENAIFHGISVKDGNGSIQVRGYLEREKLVIEIIDDGVGMTEACMEKIWTHKEEENEEKYNHIGIKNVHERLILYFGKSYGIRIKSEVNIGTQIKVILPQILSKGDKDYGHYYSG